MDFFVTGPNFGPKIIIFSKIDDVTLFLKMGLVKKWIFGQKVPNFDGF